MTNREVREFQNKLEKYAKRSKNIQFLGESNFFNTYSFDLRVAKETKVYNEMIKDLEESFRFKGEDKAGKWFYSHDPDSEENFSTNNCSIRVSIWFR